MRKILCLSILCFSFATTAISQNPWELGGEYMRSMGKNFKSSHVGPRYETFNKKHSWVIGLTYNFSSKQSYSGYKGFGMYAGYRYGFIFNEKGTGNAFVGGRLWFSFDNFDGKTSLNSLFFTPMAEAGYHFTFKTHYAVTPFVGYGFTKKITKEFNSLDEDFGGRLLPGIDLGYRF
jgi:hypothetical protein